MTPLVRRQLPNTLTTIRLLMAIPIVLLILREQYAVVLWLALLAGLSDGVDGWLARRWQVQSRYGAIVDPLSDKALLTGSYVSLALVDVLPLWLAFVVVGRDIIIVGGALAYHALIGAYTPEPSMWGKLSTLVQIVVVLAFITQQVLPLFPEGLLQSGIWCVLLLALFSGGHYIGVWGKRALVR